MADYAAKATDVALEVLEKRIRSVYTQAQKEIEEKTKDFWERHATKDALYRQQVKDGKISAEDYQAWMRGQVFQGEQWKSKLQQVQATLAQANKEALNIINGGRIQVIATNLNWTAYNLEKTAGVNFGFGLYDSSAVTRLLRDNPDLLPAKKLNVPKDKLWNKGNINRQISQGIIQGESLDKIAKRLRTVTDMNKNSSLTNARTMMTGAQNAGRQERYQEAKKKGIRLKKEWLATLDGHTRATHAALDGQAVETDEPFKIGGFFIMYPGDRNAPPALVYGCRCTTVAKLERYPDRYSQRRDNVTGKPIKDMTYKQWERYKSGDYEPEEEFIIPDRVRKSINAGMASDDWFEYEIANVMREYIQTGVMPKKDMYGVSIDIDTRQRLAAEAELIQEKGAKTNTKYRTLYRGMVMDEEEVKSAFKLNSVYRFDSITSTAVEEKLARVYSDVDNAGGEGVPVMVVIQKPDGVYGFNREDTEIVIPKGSEFRVSRVFVKPDGTYVISLYAKKGKNVVVVQ